MPAWDVSGWTLPQVYRVYRLLPSFTVFCDVDQMKPSFATIQLKGEIQVDLVLKNSKRMLSRIFKGNSDLLSLTVSLLPKLVLFCIHSCPWNFSPSFYLVLSILERNFTWSSL